MAIIAGRDTRCKVEDIKVYSGEYGPLPGRLRCMGIQTDLHEGNATIRACEDAKKQLLEFAYAKMGLNVVYDLDIKDRWVHIVARPERGMPFDELCKMALRAKADRGSWAGVTILLIERYDLPGLQLHDAGGRNRGRRRDRQNSTHRQLNRA